MAETPPELPTYRDLIYPTLTAVDALGGSAQASEITNRLLADLNVTDEQLGVRYENREKSVLIDRMDWARSYAKLGGALDSPRRGLFLLSAFGHELLGLPREQAVERIHEMDRAVREARRRATKAVEPREEASVVAAVAEDEAVDEDETWRTELLRRLHALTPTGFEEFVIYLLRTYGLQLTRVGGSGDEGIDGIGLAPISPVLSSRVAVQAKKYEPDSPVSRDAVALFQRDAAAAGAERAVFVTLGRFTEPARRAAGVATPTVDLIDGQRLCDLAHEQEVGVKVRPVVDENWFARFGRP